MSIQIKRTGRSRGVSRYRVKFPTGLPFEFLIQSPPRPQTREWQLLFLRCLTETCDRMRRYMEGK